MADESKKKPAAEIDAALEEARQQEREDRDKELTQEARLDAKVADALEKQPDDAR